MSLAKHPYAAFLHEVETPARYAGGERFSVVKESDDGLVSRMAFCFPDVYDIGMSHLGTKILYKVVNDQTDLAFERCFCPWPDMEAKLRERNLPLVSLETRRPLRDFDLVGFSLQYELTFTNVLTMLDLGGLPLHAAERGPEDPLVLAGGPVATQPEPLAPFVDAFLIGDAEERLPALMREHARLREAGVIDRMEMLARLSADGGLYCPALYEREVCPRSGFAFVAGPAAGREAPLPVERAFLDDVNRFPFPDDSPVPIAEAVFDRTAIEIARGCTEGCRFCQAGMIYRPVREREPKEIVRTVVSAVEKGGYDEAALTSLSTADYSCVAPLVREVMAELVPRRVSLGISSLRAYGLPEEVLDDISQVKATGLTFAPEAGSQRMRDVVNKNVSEEDIYETCRRVFSRGWDRAKLYFMIGLPTEEDDDVLGIADMGRQARRIGDRLAERRVRITVSVSSHVPKPHTPFQWCAQDSMEEISRKQALLRERARADGFRLKTHDQRVSHLEGILARGDIRAARLVEIAWRKGARFDGWDEKFRWDLWCESLDEWEDETGVSRTEWLGTIPVDGRLPWDHVDVGLAEGFLLREYRRSLKDRISPPCGKPFPMQVHHTNAKEARADERKLVCYHCGVACDLGQMRDERIAFLEGMGAEEPRFVPAAADGEVRLPVVAAAAPPTNGGRRRPRPPERAEQGEPVRYRAHFAKFGPMALRGHGELIRIVPRILRRAGLPIRFTEGFSPRPQLSFGPALPLGIQSAHEVCEFALTEALEPEVVLAGLRRAAEEGLRFDDLVRLPAGAPRLSRWIAALRYAVLLPADSAPEEVESRLARFREARAWPLVVTRRVKKKPARGARRPESGPEEREVTLDLAGRVDSAGVEPAGEDAPLLGCAAARRTLRFRVLAAWDGPSPRPAEIARSLAAFDPVGVEILRTATEPAGEDAGASPESPSARGRSASAGAPNRVMGAPGP